MTERSDTPGEESETVMTPGGPRPREMVHGVRSGEAVYGNGGGRPVVASVPSLAFRAKAAAELVLTPGGRRPKSAVHKIEPGAVLDAGGDTIRKLHASGEVLADYGAIAERPAETPLMPRNVAVVPDRAPLLGSGWITFTDWTNNTGQPISSFSTTWVVPPEPHTQSGQTIFLFNGIQNPTMIYQPVLQWGPSGAGGGSYWAVASWYVDGQGGAAFYSTPVRVNPGDVLVGVMTLTGQSPAGFSYNCEFQGIANTGLPIQNVQELTFCIETLEAYAVTQCSDYPNTTVTSFTGISIQTGATSPALTWNANNSVTDCGQHAVVVSDANPGGQVDLYYRNPGDWSGVNDNWRPIGGFFPTGAPVSAVARTPDNLDLFITGNDGRVYTSWWYAGADWSGVNDNWRPIGGFFPPGAPVSAVARTPDNLDLFITGNDGRVYTSWWYAGADWSGVNDNWRPIGGFFPPGAPVSAVARTPDNLDLFITGNDGRVYTSWWYAGADWSGVNDNWRGIGGFFPHGAPVAAVARTPNNLDLFIAGNDGRVYTSWWYAGADWSGVNDNWRGIGGFFPIGAPVAAVARTPTTSICSSPATTAASTRRGGTRELTGPGSTTTGAGSAASSRSARASARSPAHPTTSICSSPATTAASTRRGGTQELTGRG